MSRGTSRAALSAALLCAALVTATAPPATAAAAGDWSTWGAVGGARGAWTTSLTLPGLGGPVATVTSTSTTAELGTGASTWMGPSSPPGTVFGTSRDRRYLTLRAAGSGTGSPSTTTYTFDEPPAVGWGFVLGDIDADAATVSATTAAGAAATPAELGFVGAFNACDTTPRPSSLCPAASLPTDRPTWEEGDRTLTGNLAASDTNGATGWFRPTVPLRSVTVAFRARSGSPVFQTWLAGQTRAVSGTVSGPAACDPTTAQVVLLDGSVVLARTTPAADGSWSFAPVAARDGLVVRLADRPDGCRAVAGVDRPVAAGAVDTTGLDLPVDVNPVAEVTVSSTVLDTTGRPVPDAEVRITGPSDLPAADQEEERAVTDAQGRLEVDLLPGDHVAVLVPPAGWTVRDDTRDVEVPPGGGAVDLGFVLDRVPAPSPTPTASASPSAAPTATPAPSPGTSQAAPAPASGVLPDTGGPAGGLVPTGALLVVAGAGLVVGSRRGRPRAQRGAAR